MKLTPPNLQFEEDVIRFFTLQILDGLEYLHGLGILHRDMKADNILIDQDGMCKISDFGTSKKSGAFGCSRGPCPYANTR